MSVKILHNPRCSKSRATLALLEEKGIQADIVKYLENPPDEAELRHILSLLKISPRALLRNGEAAYKEQNLNNPELTDDQLIQAMLDTPKLIERPIVIKDNQTAAIGRPPEKILELF